MIDLLGPNANRLTEKQVRERLALVTKPEIAKDIYDFGNSLLKESAERVKGLESKATLLAGYGIAVITLLVSSSASWSKVGNNWSFVIAAVGAICGFICTTYAVSALKLGLHALISQDEWLEEQCLAADFIVLQRYRVLTLWGTIDSYMVAHARKASRLLKAQFWLTVSAAFLLLFLLQLTFINAGVYVHWATRR